MSVPAHQGPLQLLELPTPWLAYLVQHVASGHGGLSSAAALSQTCNSLHALSESSAVTYRNLHQKYPLWSLDHPFWPWLAKRHGRVAGLTGELRLTTVDIFEAEPEQLLVLFGIPGLHLSLSCRDVISTADDPVMAKVLRPHGHLIDHLTYIVNVDGNGVKLQDFIEAAASCRSVDLTVGGSFQVPINMGDFEPLAGSLAYLNLESNSSLRGKLQSLSSLSLLSQLTSLSMNEFDLAGQEPWVHLAGLTNLKQLSLHVAASGDPSPLSALTGLSSLDFGSYVGQGCLITPCSFSSLQPLSTMQQLNDLQLWSKACSATSLHGLAELSRLQGVNLEAPMLRSLEGFSTALTSLTIHDAPHLDSLAGIEHLQNLQKFCLVRSGVSSLHPLAALGSLQSLYIGGTFTSLAGLEGNVCTCLCRLTLNSCRQLRQLSGVEGLTALQRLDICCASGLTSLQPVGQLVGGLIELHVSGCYMVQEEVLELPHIQPTARVSINHSNVKVVLAGGVRRGAVAAVF